VERLFTVGETEMYLPKHFATETSASILQLQQTNAFDLVTLTDAGLVSSLVPLLFVPPIDGRGHGSLQGHLARANPQWKSSSTMVDALVIANSVNAYVSPSAYPSKQVDGKVVPTWNYGTVHAYGKLVIHDEPEWTRDLVRRLTEHHERQHAAARTAEQVTGREWAITDAPADYIDTMLRAIVGIEIRLTRVEGKSKLSQNRSVEDRLGVANDLADGTISEQMVATEMVKLF
jgi:transcriptional regulator